MADLNLDLDFRLRSVLRWGLAGLMMVSGVQELASEGVTLTTYYPAPTGAYSTLITTGQTTLARDGGNVGVGTTSPAQKLEVAGYVKLSGTRSVLFTQGDNATTHVGGVQFLTNSNGVSNFWTPTDAGGTTVNGAVSFGGFGSFNSNAVGVNISGNVGILNNAPLAPLDVTGVIRNEQNCSEQVLIYPEGTGGTTNICPGQYVTTYDGYYASHYILQPEYQAADGSALPVGASVTVYYMCCPCPASGCTL